MPQRSQPTTIPEVARVLKAEAFALGFELGWDEAGAQVQWAGDARVRARSHGEVARAELLNFRTDQPEPAGLLCPRTFGPLRDFECSCRRLFGIKYEGAVCEECGVEVTRARVRRHRVGHIELAAPVVHPWLVETLASLLERDPTSIREASGAGLHDVLVRLYLGDVARSGGERGKLAERLSALGITPAALLLRALPVLPAGLRPFVSLPGGRFATADVNDHYRRLIVRNNRLRRLLGVGAPAPVIRRESQELFRAVEVLFDNEGCGSPVCGPDGRVQRSLFGMMSSRACESLLAKRVDFSGAASLVVDPDLAPRQCRVPRELARELFKPFVYERLEAEGHADGIRDAKAMGRALHPAAERALVRVATGCPVILNVSDRVVAREIQLWDCPAIAVNRDTAKQLGDGPVQIHLPLSSRARAEVAVMDDLPRPHAPAQSGWFSRLVAGDLLPRDMVRAAIDQDVDPLEDRVLRLALGLSA